MFSAEEQNDEAALVARAYTPAAQAEAVVEERTNLAIIIKTAALDALDAPAEAVEAPRKPEAAAALAIAEDESVDVAILAGSQDSEDDVSSPAPIVIEDGMADPAPVLIEVGAEEEMYFTLPYFGGDVREDVGYILPYPTDPWERIDDGIAYPMPIVIDDGKVDPAPVLIEVGAEEEMYFTLPYFGEDVREDAGYMLPYPADPGERVDDGMADPMPVVIVDEEIYHTLPWFGDERGEEAAPYPMPNVIDDGLWFEILPDYPIRTGSELTPMPEVVICFPHEDMSVI